MVEDALAQRREARVAAKLAESRLEREIERVPLVVGQPAAGEGAGQQPQRLLVVALRGADDGKVRRRLAPTRRGPQSRFAFDRGRRQDVIGLARKSARPQRDGERGAEVDKGFAAAIPGDEGVGIAERGTISRTSSGPLPKLTIARTA